MAWQSISKAALAVALCPALFSGLVAAADSPSTFSLYAYGDSFYGEPVVYNNGMAYIFKGNTSNSTTYTPVNFTTGTGSTTTTTTLVGNPSNSSSSTTSSNATWSDQMLYIPSDQGSQIGFTSSPADGQQTEVFRFISNTAVVANGNYYSAPFHAVSIGNDAYELRWNGTGGTPVSLRQLEPYFPSSSSSKKRQEIAFTA